MTTSPDAKPTSAELRALTDPKRMLDELHLKQVEKEKADLEERIASLGMALAEERSTAIKLDRQSAELAAKNEVLTLAIEGMKKQLITRQAIEGTLHAEVQRRDERIVELTNENSTLALAVENMKKRSRPKPIAKKASPKKAKADT